MHILTRTAVTFATVFLLSGTSVQEVYAGGISIEGPNVLIDIGKHKRKKRRWRSRQHRHDRYCGHDYYHGSRYRDRYYDDYDYYRSRDYRYRNRYYNNYYGYGDRYRDRGRICPTYGYSRYWYSDRECYRHKDHYHCTD